MDSLAETFHFFELPDDLESTRAFILDQSVVKLLKQAAADFHIPYDDLKNLCLERLRSKNDQITLMSGALEVIEWTKGKGITNFVYTHKCDSTLPFLERLEVRKYFIEVFTSANGLQRKPNPEAIHYLMDKY